MDARTPQAPDEDFDEVTLERRRSRTRGLALLLILSGLGVICLGLGQPVILTVVLVVAGFGVGGAQLLQGSMDADELAADRQSSSDFLASLPDATGAGLAGGTVAGLAGGAGGTGGSAATAEEGASEPAQRPAPVALADREGADWLDRRLALERDREEAEELSRAARRRWHQLAGPDADPFDADAIIRAHDPQLAFDPKVADASPTVRTVAAFHRKALARWRVMWAALGHDDPPAPALLEPTLDGLLGDHRAALAEQAALEVAQARVDALAVVSRPLVLIEPSQWIEESRLGQLVASVPPEGEVLAVERAP